jgi:hypothetical protein
MGMRYTLRLYKGTDAATFRNGMEHAAGALSGSITWGVAGSGDGVLRLSHDGDVHTVFIPYQGTDFTFCREVGRLLRLPWLELRIEEGSLWDYSLYLGDESLDNFSVCPQYWDGGDPETIRERKGKPDILASTWGLPVGRIERYLVNWGYQVDEKRGTFSFERKGKAYPTDAYPYGNYEQYFDVLRALGGQEPTEQHTITLPNQLVNLPRLS